MSRATLRTCAEVYGIIEKLEHIDFKRQFLYSVFFIAPVSNGYFLAGIERKVEKSELYCRLVI